MHDSTRDKGRGQQRHTDTKRSKNKEIKQGCASETRGASPSTHTGRTTPPQPNATRTACFCRGELPGSAAGRPLPFRLADAGCSSRHRQVTAPPPHHRVRLLLGEAAAHRAGCAPTGASPLTLPASVTVFPLPTSPTRCAHPSTATSPRPPIRLRLIFFFFI